MKYSRINPFYLYIAGTLLCLLLNCSSTDPSSNEIKYVLMIDKPENIIRKDTYHTDFKSITTKISEQYDISNPPQYSKEVMNHPKRCSLQNLESSVYAYKERIWKEFSHGYDIFVTSPCIGSDSFGNYLGNYFESVLCAQYSGLHFVTVAKVWQPDTRDEPTPFIARLPHYLPPPMITHSYQSAVDKMAMYCKCPSSCHERSYALWIQGLHTINTILRDALQFHISQDSNGLFSNTIISATDKANTPEGTVLPFLPDVAIHYRCGDNFIGHYGFVPFGAFIKYIPKSARTVYVLSEAKGRKTSQKRHMEQKCDAILSSLYKYLVNSFPKVTVVLKRGDDMYADFARLAYSPVVICSISTFCLWPAVMNNGTAVYFPQTRLIAGGNTTTQLGKHFHWFSSPAVVKGVLYEHGGVDELIKHLSTN